MIEDDPARANHDHAMQIERRIASATTRYKDALTEASVNSKRYDAVLMEILGLRSDNLRKAQHHSDAAFVHHCWLEDSLPEVYFPSLNLLDLDEVPDPDAAKEHLSHFDEHELAELNEWSKEQRKHDKLSAEYRGKLDRHDRRLLEEFEYLRGRAEPLGFDVENRKMELAQARALRGETSEDLDLDAIEAAAVDGVPGLGFVNPSPHPSISEELGEDWWQRFNDWADGKEKFPSDEPDSEPVPYSSEPTTEREANHSSYVDTGSGIVSNRIEDAVAANDRGLAFIDKQAAEAENEAAKREDEMAALMEQNKVLTQQVSSLDYRQKRKFIRVPGLYQRDNAHPHFVNAVNALNELLRQVDLIDEPFEVMLKLNAKGEDAHPREMLALRHGIMHRGGPLRFVVKSRLDMDKNDIYVWCPDHKAFAYICILANDVGTWSVATAKHEDPAWVHAENTLFPGIKHRVGRFHLAELVAKHREIKEYYEANTKDVG